MGSRPVNNLPSSFLTQPRRRDHLAGGQLQPVTFHFTTTGGDCQSAVKARWSKLLQRMGLNPNFYFDGEQFKPPPPPRRPAVDLPQRRIAGAQGRVRMRLCMLMALPLTQSRLQSRVCFLRATRLTHGVHPSHLAPRSSPAVA